MSSLGLAFDSWERLPEYIWIASACQLATLALVPFLRDAKPLASLHLLSNDDGGDGHVGAATATSGVVDEENDDARRSPLLDHEH